MNDELVTLLTLVRAKRIQTLHLLSISNNVCLIAFRSLLEHNRPGIHQPCSCITLLSYSQYVKLCVVSALQEYFKRTQVVRGQEKRLF